MGKVRPRRSLATRESSYHLIRSCVIATRLARHDAYQIEPSSTNLGDCQIHVVDNACRLA